MTSCIVCDVSSQHSGARHFLAYVSDEWEGWRVGITWMTDDDGRAVPVRLELTGIDGDLTTDEGVADLPCTTGPIRALTREVTKRLPLGELVEASREQMIATGGATHPCVDPDAYVDTSTHIGRLTRAAHIHAEERANGAPNPSKRTAARLAREGITARSGELSDTRVRTWIAEAKRRGLYPGEEGQK